MKKPPSRRKNPSLFRKYVWNYHDFTLNLVWAVFGKKCTKKRRGAFSIWTKKSKKT